MNDNHVLCAGPEWAETVRTIIIPSALGAGDLGADVLEVGPGYGATTDVLRDRVGHLTAVEIDPVLAAALGDRLVGTNVTVVVGDATALDFGADRFSGASCFSMLHHVPTVDLQDRLVAEVARVVQPGGLFVASDSVHSHELEAFHVGDTYAPLDPAGIAARLERVGFHDVEVRANEFGWAALARA